MQWAQNIRYAFRQLRRNPGFAFTAILTLALGIGATTAVFSVVEQMLLTQLPYRDADRIVALETFFTDRQRLHPRVTGGNYQDMRADAAFASTAFYQGGEMGVQLPDHATFTQMEVVSPSFLAVFGIHPQRGAIFRPGDASHQALVSEAFADAELGGVSAAVGKLISVESESYQVTGVMPRAFDFPQKTSIWLGASATPDNVNRNSYNYHAVARLRDGVDVQHAQLRLNALSTRLAKQFPVDQAHVALRAVPLRDALTGSVRTSLWLWLAAVGVLLLIACANVAHLQLVRISAQEQALAVRGALGASRARIVGSVLLEAGLISLLGGIAGLLLSIPSTRLLMHLLASQLPRSMGVTPDPRLLGFCLVLAVIVTVLSATLPCWWAVRRDPAAALSRGTRSGSTDRGTALWRRGLLALEIALSFLLVTTSGLLLRTLQHIHETPLGFASENRLVVYAHAPARGLAEMQKRVIELAQLTGDLRELPGVVSAAQTMGLPAGQYGSNGDYAVPGKGQAYRPGGPAVRKLQPRWSWVLQRHAHPADAGPGCHRLRYIRIAARRHHQRVAGASVLRGQRSVRAADHLRLGRGFHAGRNYRRCRRRCAPGFSGRRAGADDLYAAGATPVPRERSADRAAHRKCSRNTDPRGAAARARR